MCKNFALDVVDVKGSQKFHSKLNLQGKVDEFLQRHRPDHFEALQRAGILSKDPASQ